MALGIDLRIGLILAFGLGFGGGFGKGLGIDFDNLSKNYESINGSIK